MSLSLGAVQFELSLPFSWSLRCMQRSLLTTGWEAPCWRSRARATLSALFKRHWTLCTCSPSPTRLPHPPFPLLLGYSGESCHFMKVVAFLPSLLISPVNLVPNLHHDSSSSCCCWKQCEGCQCYIVVSNKWKINYHFIWPPYEQ